MKILGIVCSPRKEGNTAILVNEVLKEAKKYDAKIEIIRIDEMNILPCDGCESCHDAGKCRIYDDMQKIYNKRHIDADGIILGSPARA